MCQTVLFTYMIPTLFKKYFSVHQQKMQKVNRQVLYHLGILTQSKIDKSSYFYFLYGCQHINFMFYHFIQAPDIKLLFYIIFYFIVYAYL